MKINVLSDLHLEFGYAFDATQASAADVVVLAGDINLGTAGIEWAKTAFPGRPVIYVAGNHEFYKNHWIKLLAELHVAAAGSNVHVLENERVIIDGVRFLGCSLWTDFKLFGDEQRRWAMIDAEASMTDYKKIRAPRVRPGFRDEYSKLKPIQTLERFNRSIAFLREELESSFEGSTVVVTHHAPVKKSVPARYADSLTSAAYASDLSDLLSASGPDVWIHGHIHESVDFQVERTRIVCNPRGYPSPSKSFECTTFDPDLIVDI